MTPLVTALVPAAALALTVVAAAPTPRGDADTAALSGRPTAAPLASGEQRTKLPPHPVSTSGTSGVPDASDTASAPGASSPPSTPGASRPPSTWGWPLAAPHPVVRPFVAPASRYGAGHRGLDVAGTPGAPVRAVDSGTVSHVGVVAGKGTLTLLHPNGLRSTYEPVAGSVTAGQIVRRGETIAALMVDGTHCPPQSCLHLGAVAGATYLDPLSLLAQTRVRLLPLTPRPPTSGP